MLVGTTSCVGLLPLPAAALPAVPAAPPPALGRLPPLPAAEELELQLAAVSSGSHSHAKDLRQVLRTLQA
jgi:hypothetical protein